MNGLNMKGLTSGKDCNSEIWFVWRNDGATVRLSRIVTFGTYEIRTHTSNTLFGMRKSIRIMTPLIAIKACDIRTWYIISHIIIGLNSAIYWRADSSGNSRVNISIRPAESSCTDLVVPMFSFGLYPIHQMHIRLN